MDNSFSGTPQPPRTPRNAFDRRQSVASAGSGVGAHTPRTPYATVHKARMITSTIRRRRRRQNQLEEVMTPHALRARQTLAHTPGRRIRLGVGEDGIIQRISPRDELRALSRVLAREKQVREKLEELNMKAQEESEIKASNSNNPIETPTNSRNKESMRLDEDHQNSNTTGARHDSEEITPSKPPTNSVPNTRSAKNSFFIQSRSVSPDMEGERSLNMSQLTIEIPRNVEYNELGLANSTRLSEVFPEFDLTQGEIIDDDEESDVGENNSLEDLQEQKRKDSNPFVIEVDDFEIPDISQIPDNVTEFTIDEENNDIAFESEEPELNILEDGIADARAAERSFVDQATTPDDHEAYSHFVDENQDLELDSFNNSNFFDDRPDSTPARQSLLQSIAGTLGNVSLENSVQNEPPLPKPLNISSQRAPRIRTTVPASVIKDLVASMTTRKLQPAALAEIMEASEEFFQQAGLDLAAYARHSKRKTIDAVDVLQLMRRQRATTSNTASPTVLAQKYLPQELVDEIIEATTKD